MEKVAVLDYGSSNLRSVAKALEYVAGDNFEIIIADQAQQLESADRIVFPGQGAIGQCMKNLMAGGFSEILSNCIGSKPFLGICLGLQSLMDGSDEDGGVDGLGIIPGRVIRFPENIKNARDCSYKIPHMGWNQVAQMHDHQLWHGIDQDERFYFVHSYYVQPDQKDDIAGLTNYITDFAAAVARDNLFAVQFHPEKSQQAGLVLLRNFLDWDINK